MVWIVVIYCFVSLIWIARDNIPNLINGFFLYENVFRRITFQNCETRDIESSRLHNHPPWNCFNASSTSSKSSSLSRSTDSSSSAMMPAFVLSFQSITPSKSLFLPILCLQFVKLSKSRVEQLCIGTNLC